MAERYDIGELGFKVGGDIGSRDGCSVGKYIKYGFNVRISDIVGWCVDIGVDDGVCKYVEVKVIMSKVMSVLRLLAVKFEVFDFVFVMKLVDALVMKQTLIFVMNLVK